jgi:hypothetical protein
MMSAATWLRLGLLLVVGLLVMPLQAQQTTPVAAVEAFYNAYLRDASASPEPARQEPAAYSDYLTADFVTRTEALLASFAEEGPGYDPFLCAQSVPSVFTTEIIRTVGGEATALLQLTFGDNPNPLNLTLKLAQEDSGWKISDVICGETITARGVTEDFYSWYLGYVRPDEAGNFRNPLVEGAYRDYPYLTPELSARIDAVVAGGLMADPFLCAQDVPAGVTTFALTRGDVNADVLVRTHFGAAPSYLLAQLVRQGDQWLLDAVICDPGPDAFTQHFYNQYIAQTRYDIVNETGRTPITDWGYGVGDLLGDGLRASLAALAQDETRAADPVLCAQDLPERVVVEVVTVEGSRAEMRVSGLYAQGPDTFSTAALALFTAERNGSVWTLTDIACARSA